MEEDEADAAVEDEGDYETLPYSVLQKFDDYEERLYPSVVSACTEMTYAREEEDTDGADSSSWNLVKMMQQMMNKKSWKNKPSSKMFMKLFR